MQQFPQISAMAFMLVVRHIAHYTLQYVNNSITSSLTNVILLPVIAGDFLYLPYGNSLGCTMSRNCFVISKSISSPSVSYSRSVTYGSPEGIGPHVILLFPSAEFVHSSVSVSGSKTGSVASEDIVERAKTSSPMHPEAVLGRSRNSDFIVPVICCGQRWANGRAAVNVISEQMNIKELSWYESWITWTQLNPISD